MSCPRPHLIAATAVLALTGGGASAQTLAADLWSEWQETSIAMGQEMTATASQQGNSLILQNFATRSDADGVVTTGAVDQITLTEQGDGSISVTMSNPYTIAVDFPNDTGDRVSLSMLMNHENLGITVSGPAGDRNYAYAADAIRIEEGPITSEAGGPPPVIDMEIVARGLVASYDVTGTDPETQSFESTGSTDSLAGRIDIIPPPDEQGRLKASFGLGQMTSVSSGSLGALIAMQDGANGLPPDFAVAAELGYGWSRFEMDFDDGSENFDLVYNNEGGTLAFSLNNDAISYELSASGISTSIAGSEIPVPVQASAASSEFAFLMPLSAQPAPSDAAVRMGYTDLTVSDGLWSMIDPSGQVPRSPVTLLLDATAQVQLMIDLMSPEAMAMDSPPGELRALNVEALELSFGDTSLTGDAAMTFAPGQVPPQPVGQANLSLSGGNALLEQLQAAGVIDAQQAGMARGVTAMFARPGALPDTLETTIDFLPGGSITANGIPLQ